MASFCAPLAYPDTALVTPLTCWYTAWIPQKHPPASTAVSSPALCAGASAAGGGIVTAGSACAANGAKARAAAMRRAGRFMVRAPGEDCFPYREEIARRHHTKLHVCVRGASF